MGTTAPAAMAQANETALTGRLTEVALSYQRLLARDPRHPQALVGMCLVALASRQTPAAVEMASAAVEAAPEMGTAWVALGQALRAAGRVEDAGQAYGRAICLDGMNELARLGRGELKLAAGQPEAALLDFELALKRKPALVAAHLGRGNALAVMSRFEAALESYQRALDLWPRLPEAEFAAGFALARLGRLQEAETRYRRALVARPDFAAAWLNLGSLLRETGRDGYAEAALTRAVELRPDLVSGWINLAMLERERLRPEKAEAHLRRALALNPEQVETLIAWCQFRAGEQDLPGAWGWLRWALARAPDQPEALNMKGILLHAEGCFGEAVQAFEQAEALGHRAACSNRGNTLLDLGRMDEALAAHAAAVEQDPTHPGAQYNLALTQLRLGEWARGWAAYEARLRFREVHRHPRTFTQPRWRGESLHGQRILLHAEQGLGDTIQFCRYAEHVAERGGFPVLEVQVAAERLLKSLAVLRAGRAEIAVQGRAAVGRGLKFDLECPLLSLPAVFGTTVVSVPWTGAYLEADPELAAAKLVALAGPRPNLRPTVPPRVGLAWAGNPRYKADRHRSMPLATLLTVLRTPGIDWVSLQKGEAAGQLSGLPDDIYILDAASEAPDLADTAAVIGGLDLVITTDTCIAHLAGAMGKPVWILLPHLSDWRWMQEMETTPWYPTARLLRQPTPGDWGAVVERAIAELNCATVLRVLRHD
jgi:tetratricopeptide (TPR) repeat protein